MQEKTFSSATLTPLALAFALSLGAPSAFAAGLHEGDVLPRLVDGTIVIDDLDDKEVDFVSGLPIFESDFGDFAAGPFETPDPGFDHEAGEFTPGTLLAFRTVRPLEFWNGSAWTGSTATISVIDAVGKVVNITSADSSVGGFGLIAMVDGDGNVHQHIDYKINAGAAVGAYAVALSLFGLLADQTTPVYTESAPYMVIFNRGLSTADFETAVAARVVPVPAAAWLLASGIAGLGLARRRGAARVA